MLTKGERVNAAVFSKVGGPDVIQFTHLPDPAPGPEDVLIRTEAIGLNFADLNRRRGVYPIEPPAPYVLGYEGAGVVVAAGSDVKEFSKGDRVGFAHVPRANAELVVAPAWKVIPLPEQISFETAAGILLQGLTAHYLTHDSFKLSRGHTALIHSASGGVGLLLLQIARILGVRTLGTVSSPNKATLARKAGAAQVIVRAADWTQQVLEATNGEGVDIAYDAIGTTLIESLSVTRPQGTVVYYGQAGGIPPHIDPNLLMSDSKSLVGGELWSHISTREALLARSRTLFSWVTDGRLTLGSIKKYPLSRTAQAHEALESGETQGKILLMPDEL